VSGPTGTGKGSPGDDRPDTRQSSDKQDSQDSQAKDGEHRVSLGDIMDPKTAAQAAEKLHQEEQANAEKSQAAAKQADAGGGHSGATAVPKFFTTDLNFSPKSAGTLGLGKDQGVDMNRLLNQGLTKELGKELSRDALNVEAFKEPMKDLGLSSQQGLDSAANRGLFMPLGLRQHFQLRKSETAQSVPERPLAS